MSNSPQGGLNRENLFESFLPHLTEHFDELLVVRLWKENGKLHYGITYRGEDVLLDLIGGDSWLTQLLSIVGPSDMIGTCREDRDTLSDLLDEDDPEL